MARKIDAQIEDLYRQISADVEKIQEGGRFLSFSRCQEKYNCSRRVLEYVLERLCAEKRIRIQSRKGIYAAPGKNEGFRVSYIHADWPQEYQDTLYKYFERELCSLPGVTLSRQLVPPVAKLEDYLRLLTRENTDAAILCGGFRSFTQKDIAKLLNSDVALIFTENHLVFRSVNLINSMPEYTGMLAADYLYKRGHRKIALVNADDLDVCLRREIDGFIRYLELQGIAPEIIDCRHPACESSLASAEEKGKRYLQKHGVNFTAAFVCSVFSARGFYSALNDLGYSIPDDVSIIANSEVPSAAALHPPLTTIARDFQGYAETAKKMITMIRQGKQPGIMTVPSFIVERQSVKDISKKQ